MKEAKILIVEDEVLPGMELQESLLKAGYIVPDIITNSETVLSAVVKEKPDLVIMDINLGSYTDGVSLVQRMQILGDTPVIYLTAYKDQSTKDRALSTHPAYYLVKPVSEDYLYKVVENAFDRQMG